jgi:hypothetical protein
MAMSTEYIKYFDTIDFSNEMFDLNQLYEISILKHIIYMGFIT